MGQGDKREFFAILPLAVIISFVGFFIFRPPPALKPSNRLAFGCYGADNAPDILIDENGLRVNQPDFPAVHFDLFRTKSGIALNVKSSLDPIKRGSTYRFEKSVGDGRIWWFYVMRDGRAYHTGSEYELQTFQIFGSDNYPINYVPVSKERCDNLSLIFRRDPLPG